MIAIVGVIAGILAGLGFGRAALRRQIHESSDRVEGRVREIGRAGAEAVAAIRRDAELRSREEAMAFRAEIDRELALESGRLDLLRESVTRRENLTRDRDEILRQRAEATQKRENDLRSRDGNTRAQAKELERLDSDCAKRIEEIAGETASAVRERLCEALTEEARAEAAAQLRNVDANAADPEHTRQAKRVMALAMQRYDGHFLTERLVSTLPVAAGMLDKMAGANESNFRQLEALANIKLVVSDQRDSIRLEGQDGIGREIARRVIRKYEKEPKLCEKDPGPVILGIKDRLDREIVEFGRRAFAELRIQKAHPEIVELVGRLNWRTSYTQNQWKHAIEAAILCGMIANELGLDAKIARRAALMHDIGKSLTHAIDGSHAVIGADIARRLGEDEIVANAIGAHHMDEPFNSVYAEIVAACDALSGARPGARRESAMVESYGKRIVELERIASGLRGVDSVHPVQGGREVRIYVQENRVSDQRCVELCSELAKKISAEMVFPGQIKVTVIREFKAIEIAS